MSEKITVQAAMEKVAALKAKISHAIARYQSGADKERLAHDTIKSIAAVSLVFDNPNFPGAITCQLSKVMNEVYQLLSLAEVLSGLTADDALAEDPHTFANILNAEIDSLVLEREHISRCEYEYMEELNRLAIWAAFYHQENRREFFGDDLLSWVRDTARHLWETGYYPAY